MVSRAASQRGDRHNKNSFWYTCTEDLVQSSLLYFNRSHTTPHIAFHQHHYHTDTALADHPLRPTTPSYPRRPLCHKGRPQSPQQPLQPLLAPHPTVAVSPFPIHPAPQSAGPAVSPPHASEISSDNVLSPIFNKWRRQADARALSYAAASACTSKSAT